MLHGRNKRTWQLIFNVISNSFQVIYVAGTKKYVDFDNDRTSIARELVDEHIPSLRFTVIGLYKNYLISGRYLI